MADEIIDYPDDWVTLPCLQVAQPIGTYFISSVPFRKLINLTYSDVRRIEGERREIETYLGIERPLNPKRVSELRQYVETVDASFPSSVIIAVESLHARYDEAKGVIQLRNYPDVGKILDGQHRIAGLTHHQKDDFDVIVTIFVDMDIEEQALVFATINLEQTKVSKSLTYDLYDYAKQRSPEKTAHNIVRLLDQAHGSPFRGKIKILGTANESQETISQATFVDALLPMLSKEPRRDRDDLKRGRPIKRADPSEEHTLIFRNMFIDRKDADIARVLFNYFKAVQRKWPRSWDEVRLGYVLNRTAGFRGLMLFLPYAYLHHTEPGGVPSEEQFWELFRQVRLDGDTFTAENYSSTSSSWSRLRDQLRSQTSL